MFRQPVTNGRSVASLFMAAVTLLGLSGNATFANIIQPAAQSVTSTAVQPAAKPSAAQPAQAATPVAVTSALSSADETRALLDKASAIAFRGATAVQKIQAASTDSATAEMLKNYMADMVYVPHGKNLPTDAQALDEPWVASNSGTVKGDDDDDGMVVPDINDDGHASPPSSKSGLKIPLPHLSGKMDARFMHLLKPVQNAVLSSPFGLRWGRVHEGIDLAAPAGSAIYAAEKGKVTYASWMEGYGNFVIVDHGHGFETHYAHCSKILVHVGDKVGKGEQIAKVGSTGHSTGPHLHFEVVANGVHRDPIAFLGAKSTIVDARDAHKSASAR